MGRGKKGKHRRPKQKVEQAVEPTHSAPKPNPPRPNRSFLIGAAVLAALWIGFLIALAVLT